MKKLLKIILIIIVIIIVVAFILYLVLRHVPAVTYQVEEIDSEAHWGAVSGSLGYPSEFIPDLGVCAETTDQAEYYCTYEMLESDDYTYGYGYKISVPPGDYYIYAHLVDEKNPNIGYTDQYKAYYSQFVNCGMSVDCTSHKPVKVTVDRNEHVTRIDPIDWYDY